MENQKLLRLSNLSLEYGRVHALRNINLSIGYSEIHAIVGEHGAGKSSMGQVISGMLKPVVGKIVFEDTTYSQLSLKLAIKLGIGMVYQQVFLNQHFTVAENLFFPAKSINRFIWHSKKRVHREAARLMEDYGFDIDPSLPLKNLNMSEQTLVDILKNIHKKPKLLILDEALERLSVDDLEKVVRILFDMKKKGMSILFITHRLDDIYNLADRISILKNGQVLLTDYVKNINKINLIKMAYTQIDGESSVEGLNKEFYNLLKYNEAILRNLPVNLIVTDSDHRIKLVNDHCKQYFNLKGRSHINAPLEKLFSQANRKVLKLILQAFATKEEKAFYQVPMILNRTQGVTNIKTFPIYDGTFGIGNIIIIEDVTEYDQLQKQFIFSEKLASVGLLAAGVAHEINNPLEIIFNYLSYIKYKFREPEIREAIANIHEEISSIAAIVSNLHSFSDNRRTRSEEIEINDLIAKILTLIRPNARNKQIDLSFEPFGRDIRINANKNELKQVVLNILKNSLEALNSEGKISVKTMTVDRDGSDFARITFSDTGPGILIRNPDDIFLPFFSSKNDTGKNMGLGLSVSYGIIKKYNGSLEVRNRREGGCEFIITLPLSSE
ncbi:ATP-binding cassette domain-containing protein [Desulfomarina sp.]